MKTRIAFQFMQASAFALIQAVGLLGLCADASASAAQSTTWPWQLLSQGFNGTAHSASYSPYSNTLFRSGDMGPVWRSQDCGTTWEPIDGGPGVTEGYNGGYAGCDPSAQSCDHGVIYGGPPSADNLGGGGKVASGPMPQPNAFGATTLAVRMTNNAFWSSDEGRAWYPLSPFCVGQSQVVQTNMREAAIDVGVPGPAVHLVMAAQAGQDASQCGLAPACGQRAIAWTDDASAQMAKSKKKSDGRWWDAAVEMDLASTWRYASLAHLAADAWAYPGACQNAGSDKSFLPKTTCTVNGKGWCHGGQTAQQPEDGCLDAALCNCTDPYDTTTKPPTPTCRYPAVAGLVIDPRNGWAYASTQVGLLVSPDGGRTWGRKGVDLAGAPLDKQTSSYLPAAINAPTAEEDGATDENYVLRASGVNGLWSKAKVILETGIPPNQPTANTPAPYDLSLTPRNIQDVGPVSLIATKEACATPLPGTTATTYGATAQGDPAGRHRQRIRAYIAVKWMAWDDRDAEGNFLAAPGYAARSSVFVAEAGPCADPEAPLVFKDTATLRHDPDLTGVEPYVATTVASKGTYAPAFKGEYDSSLKTPKLPRSQQYNHDLGYEKSKANAVCPLTIEAIAAAPSDSQIAYAIAAVESNSTAGCGATCIGWAAGIYRTLDGGETWKLIVGARDPQSIFEPANLVPTTGYPGAFGLNVSVNNPYVAWFSTQFAMYRLVPAAGTTKPAGPKAAAPGCPAADTWDCQYLVVNDPSDKTIHFGNNNYNNIQIDSCDKTVAVSDYCAGYVALGADATARQPVAGCNASCGCPPQGKTASLPPNPSAALLQSLPDWVQSTYNANPNHTVDPGIPFISTVLGVLKVPPQCLHHFPSQPDATMTETLYGDTPCETCGPFDAASCSDGPPVPAGPPKNCCTAVQQVDRITDSTCVTDSAGPHVLSATRAAGASEEGMYDAQVMLMNDAVTSYFVTADEDAGTNISQAEGPLATGTSGDGISFQSAKWYLKTEPPKPSSVKFAAQWAYDHDGSSAWMIGTEEGPQVQPMTTFISSHNLPGCRF